MNLARGIWRGAAIVARVMRTTIQECLGLSHVRLSTSACPGKSASTSSTGSDGSRSVPPAVARGGCGSSPGRSGRAGRAGSAVCPRPPFARQPEPGRHSAAKRHRPGIRLADAARVLANRWAEPGGRSGRMDDRTHASRGDDRAGLGERFVRARRPDHLGRHHGPRPESLLHRPEVGRAGRRHALRQPRRRRGAYTGGSAVRRFQRPVGARHRPHRLPLLPAGRLAVYRLRPAPRRQLRRDQQSAIRLRKPGAAEVDDAALSRADYLAR